MAKPYAERVIGTIKCELLDQIIPLNETHSHKILDEYIYDYYNTHQGINCKTPIPSPTYLPTSVKVTKLKATPVLNGPFHTYKKVA
jgi:putative transposase